MKAGMLLELKGKMINDTFCDFFFFFSGLSRLDLARNEAIFVFRLFVFYFFIYYNWA